MMSRTPAEALRWAEEQSRHPTPPPDPHDPNRDDWHNWCLVFCRTAYGVGSVYPDAWDAWEHTKHRGDKHVTPPAGALMWWTQPEPKDTDEFGHVAIAIGDGHIWSNDIHDGVTGLTGQIYRVHCSEISSRWGQIYRGWSRDINDVLVVEDDMQLTDKITVPAWQHYYTEPTVTVQRLLLDAAIFSRRNAKHIDAIADSVGDLSELVAKLGSADKAALANIKARLDQLKADIAPDENSPDETTIAVT